MTNQRTKSILEMARGAILERADYEMAKIIDNISDPNTAATKKRVLTISAEFTADSQRNNIMWLVDLRKQRGKTQSKIAEMCGIAQQHYGFIEKGERRPSPEVAKRIATALNFDWTLFFPDDGGGKRGATSKKEIGV